MPVSDNEACQLYRRRGRDLTPFTSLNSLNASLCFAGTEGGWGGSGCVLFKNMLHTNLRVSTAGCDVADTMAPGTCKASAYGPWQRLCPNKKGTQGQDQREERR